MAGETERTLQAQITRHWVQDLGDHGAESIEAHAYDPNEAVGDMIHRVMGLPLAQWHREEPSSFITIRIIKGTTPIETLKADF